MEIYRKAIELVREGRSVALGIVVSATGSTPQEAGSKALIDSEGNLWGTLGGGMVESRGLEAMKACLAGEAAAIFEYALNEKYSREAGPICGGVMQIFAGTVSEESVAAYARALEALDARRSGALVTNVGPGRDVGSVQWLEDAQHTKTSLYTSPDGSAQFVEPVVAPPQLLIVGAGHVGQAAALQGDLLGFDVTVVDDRESLLKPELFPENARRVCGPIRDAVESFPKDDNTFIVLVSKGHRPDAEALEACIHSDARYIGMIGSRRKIDALRQHFIDDGLATAEVFDRVVAPIGVDIGAVTVPEIGVSIAAQLVAARRLGVTMRDPEAIAGTPR